MSQFSTSKQVRRSAISFPVAWQTFTMLVKRWRMPLTYTAMSLLVVWHTVAIVTAPSPENVSRWALPLFKPYMSLFDLDNRWDFFAPSFDRGAQLRYLVEDAAGQRHSFNPSDKLSRYHPAAIWFRDRYQIILLSPNVYGVAHVPAFCREHAALNPVSITLLAVEGKAFTPADHLSGKHPLDSEFTTVTILKTVPCPVQ